MIVTEESFTEALKLSSFKEAAIDSETFGLHMYDGQACKEQGDRLFSLIISDDSGDKYFNYKEYPEENAPVLPRENLQLLKPILEDLERVWFLQNAKYDMHILAQEGLYIRGKIYDLAFLDRIHFNQHLQYNLDSITKRWGEEKLDIVKAHIEEHELYEKRSIPHLNKELKNPLFSQVPFSKISVYGLQDGRGTLNTGRKILAAIKKEDEEKILYKQKQMQVVENEARLVHTLFNMEHLGIKIDRNYCEQARIYYEELCEQAMLEFKSITGEDFVKGTSVFEVVFGSEKAKWTKTTKDNWCWDAKQLARFENPAARSATAYAEAKKQLEYFQNFLFFVDKNDVIHPSFKQAGTVTGRLSSHDPNMQNMTNPDKYEDESDTSKFPVRRAFIPRTGFFFCMIDFDQIEFRYFLDFAEASGLIDEVLKGLDVHQATANVAKVSRKHAKTVNFLSLYGGSIAKLCMDLFEPLGTQEQISAINKHRTPYLRKWMTPQDKEAFKSCTPEMLAHNLPLLQKTVEIQESIFKACPEIKKKMKEVSKKAEERGFIFNWFGRRYQFTDKKFSYKAPNHYVQGGCADILKIAMNRCDDFLKDYKSRMILTIHDELVFEIAFGEEEIIPKLKNIMETVYPYKRLPLTADVEFSFENLADKHPFTKFNEISEKARDKVQRENSTPPKSPSPLMGP